MTWWQRFLAVFAQPDPLDVQEVFEPDSPNIPPDAPDCPDTQPTSPGALDSDLGRLEEPL